MPRLLIKPVRSREICCKTCETDKTQNDMTMLMISVMRSAFSDFHASIFYPKYDSILLVNPNTPKSGKIT